MRRLVVVLCYLRGMVRFFESHGGLSMRIFGVSRVLRRVLGLVLRGF